MCTRCLKVDYGTDHEGCMIGLQRPSIVERSMYFPSAALADSPMNTRIELPRY